MSLNEGTNFSLTACVTYKVPDTVAERVEVILERARNDIACLYGASTRMEVTCAHDDCERLNRRLDYLSRFMTDAQVDRFMEI